MLCKKDRVVLVSFRVKKAVLVFNVRLRVFRLKMSTARPFVVSFIKNLEVPTKTAGRRYFLLGSDECYR